MEYNATIFDFIKTQVAAYQKPIRLNNSWDWSMREHIELSVLYKNSQLKNGKDDYTPVKNIIRPILNLQYRAEGFDVKDIVLFVDDGANYHKSLLVKKFHERWARANELDTFIDTLVESYVDFGGALVKNVNDVKPEVVPLQSIVFCDQTDILSGPIGIKHYYSPDQLLAMAQAGWGNESNGATATLEETIALSRSVKKDDHDGTITDTPGRYIEVYEVHGNLPVSFRDSTDTSGKYETQLFIGCFYEKKDGTKGNIKLFHMPEKQSPFKFIARDAVYGRALGFGGAEELFEPQVWINYDMIRMQDMLDAASKTILRSTDPTVAQKNKVRDLDNLSIIDHLPGTEISQVDTFPRNFQIFEKSISVWEAHAQQMGAANDAIMGESPTAGTPFKLQELVTRESHSLHEYRKGKLATFLDGIYRDWIIPHIVKEITKGAQFLTELNMEELQFVSERLIANTAFRFETERVLNGEPIDPEETAALKERVRQEFQQKGNKHFIKILEGELKNVPIEVRTNIVGKQKNLGALTDKLTNIFRFAFSNPAGFAQTMQIPGMAIAFNDMMEFSGLSPVNFAGIEKLAQPSEPPTQQPMPSPMAAPEMSVAA